MAAHKTPSPFLGEVSKFLPYLRTSENGSLGRDKWDQLPSGMEASVSQPSTQDQFILKM